MNTISGTSIAVIIDCASTESNRIEPHNVVMYEQTIENITQRISEISSLSAVIIATYNSNEHLESNTLPYRRSRNILYNTQQLGYIKRNYTCTYEHLRGPWLTHNNIANHQYSCGEHVYAMHDVLQLGYFIDNIAVETKNVYYFGKSWEACVQNRPIGTSELIQSKANNLIQTDFNVLVYGDGVITRTGDSLHQSTFDGSFCTKIADNLYSISKKLNS